MSGKDIFLSYASEDRGRTDPLVRALEGTGWTVFWDVDGIRTGDDWGSVLEEKVASCRSMIVVWSKASVKSTFVRDEAWRGAKRGVLFPVRIEIVEPPLGFGATQYRDLVGWYGAGSAPAFQRLVKDLSVLLGEPPNARSEENADRRTEEASAEHRLAEQAARNGEEAQERLRPRRAEEVRPRMLQDDLAVGGKEEGLRNPETGRTRADQPRERRAAVTNSDEDTRRLVARRTLRASLLVAGASIALISTLVTIRVRAPRRLPFTVSVETTRIVSPLLPDGTPDFGAALNAHFGAGLTADNNAGVPLQAATAHVVGGLGATADLGVIIRTLAPSLQASDESLANRFRDEWKDASTAPWTEADHPVMAVWIEANAGPLARITEAVQRPRYFPQRFPEGTPDWNDSPVPPLMWVRNAANALRARALLRLGRGDSAGALNDLVTCQRLATVLSSGPTLLDGLMAVAVRGIASEAVPVVGHARPDLGYALRVLATFCSFPARLGPAAADSVDCTERYDKLTDLVKMARVGPAAWKQALLEKVPAEERASFDFYPYPVGFDRVPVEAVDWNEALRRANAVFDLYAATIRDGIPAAATEAAGAALAVAPDPARQDELIQQARTSPEARRQLGWLLGATNASRRAGVSFNEADVLFRIAIVALAQAVYREEEHGVSRPTWKRLRRPNWG